MSAIDDLTAELAKLPGIGRKTATRLTFFLLKQPRNVVDSLARALTTVADKVGPCADCGNLSELDPCAICRDPRRDRSVLCVVEDASDIDPIEQSGEFRGLYHVLGGHLSPLDGIGPKELGMESLRQRSEVGSGVKEVIVATNPSMEGEVTATYLKDVLEGSGVRVTRIALGLPVGGDLEYADKMTVAQALSARRDMGA
ncbi:MAG: recombination mediator RecR [Gemmatimonadota bacterium]|nr:recombination mediator RecR [Gemmatimonadota bacterium]MDH5803714.1 recombination mediator RecR [Gemmatimonadota bacterium]